MAGVVVAVVIGLVCAAVFSRQRMRSWRSGVGGNSAVRTKVALIGGPWGGETRSVAGNLQTGAPVDSNAWGLIGDGVHDGRYFISEMNPHDGIVTAEWQLNS